VHVKKDHARAWYLGAEIFILPRASGARACPGVVGYFAAVLRHSAVVRGDGFAYRDSTVQSYRQANCRQQTRLLLMLFHVSLVEVKVLGYQMQDRKRHGVPPRA